MSRVEFPAEGIDRVRISTVSGAIAVLAEERSDFAIESGGGKAEVVEGVLTIAVQNSRVALQCPLGTDLVAGTNSGGIVLAGRLGDVAVSSLSGNVHIRHAANADVRAGSGKVVVDQCDGRARISVKSGTAELGSAAEFAGATISGAVTANVTGAMRVRSVSGAVDATAGGEGDIAVETLSGQVTVRLPEGVRPRARLASRSSKPLCDCPEGDDLKVAIRSLSGRIHVTGQ